MINNTATAIASLVSSTMPKYNPIGIYMVKNANEIRVNIPYFFSKIDTINIPLVNTKPIPNRNRFVLGLFINSKVKMNMHTSIKI